MYQKTYNMYEIIEGQITTELNIGTHVCEAYKQEAHNNC